MFFFQQVLSSCTQGTVLSQVLDVGMKFFYEYDYGSPTALVLKVVALRGQGLPKGAVQLLARNQAPQVSCQRSVATRCACRSLTLLALEYAGIRVRRSLL